MFSRKPADASFCFVFVFCVPNLSLFLLVLLARLLYRRMTVVSVAVIVIFCKNKKNLTTFCVYEKLAFQANNRASRPEPSVHCVAVSQTPELLLIKQLVLWSVLIWKHLKPE